MIALITPADFQTSSLAWITAITLVVLALVSAVAQVWAKVEVLFRLHAQNDAKINDNAMATQTVPAVTITTGAGVMSGSTGDASDATN